MSKFVQVLYSGMPFRGFRSPPGQERVGRVADSHKRRENLVWGRTHRFAGPVFMVAGLVPIVLLFFSRQVVAIGLLACIVAATLIPTVYSYLAYRQVVRD